MELWARNDDKKELVIRPQQERQAKATAEFSEDDVATKNLWRNNFFREIHCIVPETWLPPEV